MKCDVTRAETRFRLSAKRTSPFKSVGGVSSIDYWPAEVCASAVVMLDTPWSEVECKTTGYPLHSHVSPSLPVLRVTVCHQVSTELYHQPTTAPSVTGVSALPEILWNGRIIHYGGLGVRGKERSRDVLRTTGVGHCMVPSLSHPPYCGYFYDGLP